MQFDRRNREAILAGEVTLTFRRWKRRQAVPGNRYRTTVGIVEVDSVEEVDPQAVDDLDAQRAGCATKAELFDQLTGEPDLPLYRVAFHLVDDADPRDLLAAADRLTDEDRAEIDERLDRLDRASPHGAWTRDTLRLIAEHPATRAAELAAMLGRDTRPFKTDVRKLKNLGLTRSLEVGYELSPRGRAHLSGTGPQRSGSTSG